MSNNDDLINEVSEAGRFWSRTAPLYSLPLMLLILAAAINLNDLFMWGIAAFMISVWSTWFIWGYLSDRYCRKLEAALEKIRREEELFCPDEIVNIDKIDETKEMKSV